MLVSGTEVMPRGLYWPFPKEQVILSSPRILLSAQGKRNIASELLLCTHLLLALSEGNSSLRRFLDALYKSCLTSLKRFIFPALSPLLLLRISQWSTQTNAERREREEEMKSGELKTVFHCLALP